MVSSGSDRMELVAALIYSFPLLIAASIFSWLSPTFLDGLSSVLEWSLFLGLVDFHSGGERIHLGLLPDYRPFLVRIHLGGERTLMGYHFCFRLVYHGCQTFEIRHDNRLLGFIETMQNSLSPTIHPICQSNLINPIIPHLTPVITYLVTRHGVLIGKWIY
jgi:hypothetical protein